MTDARQLEHRQVINKETADVRFVACRWENDMRNAMSIEPRVGGRHIDFLLADSWRLSKRIML